MAVVKPRAWLGCGGKLAMLAWRESGSGDVAKIRSSSNIDEVHIAFRRQSGNGRLARVKWW